MEYRIRVATVEDAPSMLDIYRPYVETTAISFETHTPTIEEFENRVRQTLAKYPWLVAVDEDGTVVGYTYAGTFKGRSAYNWAVETSIYLRQDMRGQGLGKKLYEALEYQLHRMGIQNLNACIACTERNGDPYLTNGSMHFHERMGYATVGVFHNCGFKLGRWYSMLWMEKMLGTHNTPPTPVIPFPELPQE